MSDNRTNWYVVYTKPRWEKKVYSLLVEEGIEAYCPLNKVRKKWSDRTKWVEEPLFKSYVFVRVQEEEQALVRMVSGVINYIYWLGKPARIKDKDILTIRKFLHEFADVQVEEFDRLSVNAKVRIKQGVLMNYHGILLELSGNRAKVRIESMGLQLSALFDKKNLERVG